MPIGICDRTECVVSVHARGAEQRTGAGGALPRARSRRVGCCCLQALAVLRLEALPGLEEASAAWMQQHLPLLLPNHILAYLNVRGQTVLCLPDVPDTLLCTSLPGGALLSLGRPSCIERAQSYRNAPAAGRPR